MKTTLAIIITALIISVICFVPYYIGKYVFIYDNNPQEFALKEWLVGMISILIFFLIGFFVKIVYLAVKEIIRKKII